MTPDQVEHELLKEIVAMPGLLFDQKDAAVSYLRERGFGEDLLGPDTLSTEYLFCLKSRIKFLTYVIYQTRSNQAE